MSYKEIHSHLVGAHSAAVAHVANAEDSSSRRIRQDLADDIRLLVVESGRWSDSEEEGSPPYHWLGEEAEAVRAWNERIAGFNELWRHRRPAVK